MKVSSGVKEKKKKKKKKETNLFWAKPDLVNSESSKSSGTRTELD